MIDYFDQLYKKRVSDNKNISLSNLPKIVNEINEQIHRRIN